MGGSLGETPPKGIPLEASKVTLTSLCGLQQAEAGHLLNSKVGHCKGAGLAEQRGWAHCREAMVMLQAMLR